MKRYIKIASIVVFLVLITIIPISYYTIKAVNANNKEFLEKLDFDLEEKRDLVEFEYKNILDLPNDFQNYFNDHIPFRSQLITANRTVNSVLEQFYSDHIEKFILNFGRTPAKKVVQYDSNEKPMDKEVRIFTCHGLTEAEKDIPDVSLEFPLKEKGSAIIGRNNWMFFNSNNMYYYKGTNILSDESLKAYAKKINDFVALCNDYDKKVVFIMIPEKERIYGEYMPKIERKDEVGKIQRISDYLATASEATYIYPVDILKERKENYRLYGKYDTHFTNAGAYTIHNEILKALEREIIDIDDVTLDKKAPVTKDLTILAGLNPESYLDDFDYNIHYKDDVEVSLVYEDKAKPDVNCWVDHYTANVENDDYLFYYGDSFKEKIKTILNKDFKDSYYMSHLSRRDKIFEEAVKAANIIVIETVERNEQEVFPMKLTEITSVLKKMKKPEKKAD